MEVVPAVMPKNYIDLERHVSLVRDCVSSVQLDIMDGVFVPEKTWPYIGGEGEIVQDEFWKGFFTEDTMLPYSDAIAYELDLMIREPEKTLLEWIMLKPKRIVIHIESVASNERLFEVLNEIRTRGVLVGLSFDDDYDVPLLDGIVPLFDFVQCMGIDTIGSQGEPYEPRVSLNIRSLRDQYPETPVSVDGSVNRITVSRLRDAGATRFIAGSAIFGEGEPCENVSALKNLIQ